MPVPNKGVKGQTVEIRCELKKEGDFSGTLYKMCIRDRLYTGLSVATGIGHVQHHTGEDTGADAGYFCYTINLLESCL